MYVCLVVKCFCECFKSDLLWLHVLPLHYNPLSLSLSLFSWYFMMCILIRCISKFWFSWTVGRFNLSNPFRLPIEWVLFWHCFCAVRNSLVGSPAVRRTSPCNTRAMKNQEPPAPSSTSRSFRIIRTFEGLVSFQQRKQSKWNWHRCLTARCKTYRFGMCRADDALQHGLKSKTFGLFQACIQQC